MTFERQPSMTPDFYRLTSRLQAALTTAEIEQAYLEGVPGVLPADGHGLYRLDPDTFEPISISADVTSEFAEDYTEYGRYDDPVMERAYAFRRAIDSSRLGSIQEWKQSATYSILAANDYEHSLRAPVEVAGQFCGTVTFARRTGSREFQLADLRTARHIGEQMGLALDRAARYEATDRRSTVMEDALDHLPHGVIISDQSGQPLFVNRAASVTHSRIQRRLVDVVDEHLRETVDVLWRDNRRVSTSSIEDRPSGTSLVAKSVRLTMRSEASMTLVYTTERRAGARQMPVWDVLTPREQEIAEFVSTGLSTKQIAARAFVSENTVKQHLKRIFAKTDVRNRAELMQRIWISGDPELCPLPEGSHSTDDLFASVG
jgi:DNA-binding CsgD family transcriptional regulator/GAF domain-containing protein